MQSVEGMKVICHELTQAVDPESSVLDDLIKEADRLVSCLSVMVSMHYLFSLAFGQAFGHPANSDDDQSFRFQKPLISVYLGLLQGLANTF